MADTVAASVITDARGLAGPNFVVDLGSVGQASDGLHVSGGVHVMELVSGFGAPLAVEFVTWGSPAPAPTPMPPTVPGIGAGFGLDHGAPGIPGGVNLGSREFG